MIKSIKGSVFITGLICSFVLFPLVYQFDMSGTWDGDPSRHTYHALTVVNDFVEEYRKDKNPERSFIYAYAQFPKVMHEVLLSTFALFWNGFNILEFDDIEKTQIIFSTLFTIIGVLTLFFLALRLWGATIALTTLVFTALCGYVLLYANFPRHNMPAHALAWTALTIYMLDRVKLYNYKSIARSFDGHNKMILIGIILGLAVPTHYTSVYAFFAIAASEVALLIVYKRDKNYLCNIAIIFFSACFVWFILEVYYYYIAIKHPALKEPFTGGRYHENHYSFLGGMLFTFVRLQGKVMSEKLSSSVWWFLLGFWVRNFGIVGTAIIIIGFIFALLRPIYNFGIYIRPSLKQALFIGLIMTLVSIAVSLGFFQNARKLMVFLPAWLIVLGYGIWVIQTFVYAVYNYLSSGKNIFVSKNTLSIMTCIVLISIHVSTYAGQAYEIFEARRDAGYMRNYLRENNIKKVMEFSYIKDTHMAEDQVNIRDISHKKADNYKYLVTSHRMFKFRNKDGKLLRKCFRSVTPLAVFPNQASLPIFWYEFPIKKSSYDISDPMVTTRRLYNWEELMHKCSKEIIETNDFTEFNQ